jgi:hypothetical protein
VHAVFDRYIDKELVDRLKADLATMGHSRVSERAADENLARYLWKELTKQFRYRRALGRRRLWATFGRLAGFVGAKDYELIVEIWEDGEKKTYKGGLLGECKRLASEVRVTGESRLRTWQRALWMYWFHPSQNPSEEGLRWLSEHFPGHVDHGDAYEDGGGDTDFDVGEAA